MATIYDIDELKKENEGLKWACKKALEFLNIEEIAYNIYSIQAKNMLEEALEKYGDDRP